mgnify:CR=1 FL=1
MKITKEQIKELVRIAQAIDAENRIDDDVTGGYVEEPYNNIIERLYAVVNECEDNKQPESKEKHSVSHGVSESDTGKDRIIKSCDNCRWEDEPKGAEPCSDCFAFSEHLYVP